MFATDLRYDARVDIVLNVKVEQINVVEFHIGARNAFFFFSSVYSFRVREGEREGKKS